MKLFITDEHDDLEEFPARTIGGPSGDYFLTCDVTAILLAEYRVISIACGDAGPGTVMISGKGSPPSNVKWDGSISANDDHIFDGAIYRLGSTKTLSVVPIWTRVVNSQKRVSVRIDVPASTSAYVSIQFRVKRLEEIPEPPRTVHPDQGHLLNQERAENINRRLAELGIPGYAEEGTGDTTTKEGN
jgi:hypothetical protein